VARTLLARPKPGRADETAEIDPSQEPVAKLVRSKPVICAPKDSVREVARRMAEADGGASLVRISEGKLGIVTDRDLRDRVVAGDVDADAPVSEVMSAPAFTVTPDRLGAEVMIEMLDRDIGHVPVVWPHNEVLGVLTERDLMVAETRAPFTLRRAIEDASSPEELRRAVDRMRPAVIALDDARIPPEQISSVVSVVADSLTRRLLELAIDDIGPPPCPVTWLALGSLGRREITPASDVDSALVWDGDEDDEGQQRYMQDLGGRTVNRLSDFGFVGDAYGATAADPLFDRSFEAWRRIIRTAIRKPDEGKALIFLSLLSDSRPIYELGEGRDPLDELHGIRHRRTVLRLLLRLALADTPPTGLRRIRGAGVEKSGEHKGKLDIKHVALKPIVNIARYASLAAGVRLPATLARLDAASTANTIESRDAGALKEAFELFWRLRLDHQVEQLRKGEEPDEWVDPERFDPATRRFVRDAFHAIAAVQRSLKGELDLPP
jgi:CBS domain-containing protein